MQEYIFLFLLAFVWIIFAVFQDLRTREISNWLNLSLIAFVLAYRAFYSIWIKDSKFFIFGFLGVLFFVFLGYLFYYGRVFAGGDAKLLMGLGGILPHRDFFDILLLGGGFIFLLFFSGAIYTLVYSVFLVRKDKKKFGVEFARRIGEWKLSIIVSFMLAVVLFLFFMSSGFVNFVNSVGLLLIFVLPWLYIYVKTVEKVCMIKLVKPTDLQEGDWLVNDVKVGRNIIRKSVHGLFKQDIKILRKARNKVLIKDGVPFSPAFLIALAIFVLVYFL